MKKSVLKQIREILRKNGFDTYYPGQHKGECLSPYVVIKYDGATKVVGISSSVATYTIMCYVPVKHYSMLEDYVQRVKEVMKEHVFPLVRPDGNETPSVYEEETKSHMVSIEYANYRKMNFY